MAGLTYARLEWSPERDLPSYRGVTIEELETAGPRDGLRAFVRDVPGLDTGEVSGHAVAFLKRCVRSLADHRAFDRLEIPSHSVDGPSHFYVWSENTPDRISLLRGPREVRDFLSRDESRQDAMLMAVTMGKMHSPASVRVLFQSFVRAVGDIDLILMARHAVPDLELPEEGARRRSLEWRDELLSRGWPTSAELARYFGSKAENSAQIAAKKRAEGKLLGVWSVADNSFVHPDFQFDAYQQLRPDVPDLLHALVDLPGMSVEDDPGGWCRVFWLYGATAQLSEEALGDGESTEPRTAASVFGRFPKAVIDFARMEAARDPNEAW